MYDIQLLYFDGCNGLKLGDSENDAIGTCAKFLLDQDTNKGQHAPEKGPDYQSLNNWDLDEAAKAIKESCDNRTPLVLDRNGDRQVFLIVTPACD
jgi:hypothetical protein